MLLRLVSASFNYPQWTITNTIVFDFDDCYKQLLESVEKLGYQVDKEPDGQLNISRREAV